MAFRLSKRTKSSVETPEALFRDLRNRSVEGLLSQQADMLRKYMDNVNESDVALQMPTGSGKTLVGLLIAEWRRRSKHERAVYLCPTKQLVNQVVEQANDKYGIRALAFTGSRRDFSPSAQSEFLNAEVVAVTTYSGLFNTNPFFDSAQLILLDDAHAAENYIADFWSLAVEKWHEGHEALFEAVLSVLRGDMSTVDFSRFSGESDDNWDRLWVNKLPVPVLHERHDELFQVFEEYCRAGTDLGYKWEVLRDHLKACQFYYGRGRFLLRPLIAPTESHAPFADASQRVYMSATLGEGGELERLVGKRRLVRIPAPEGWDKQGIGRRLFFFPMRSLDEDGCQHLLVSMIKESGRALILTPSDREAATFRTLVETELPGFEVFNARDIETSKSNFISTEEAVAVVANRYDGIDLVGDECRLLVASGLPRATNLQEQFLISRMGGFILYNDRVRTRIVQAIGRCTRSSTDYAAVVVLGEQLNKFLLQTETRQYLHPELQAEIEFGIEESKDRTEDEFLENLRVFMDHDEVWQEVDDHIVAERDGLSQSPLPCVDSFIKAVPHEVAYQYAIWNEDYQAALDEARKVLTEIEGPPDLRGYRVFWMYLAGSAAWMAHKVGVQGMDSVAREFYKKASKAATGVGWMHDLSRLGLYEEEPEEEVDAYMDTVIERLEISLESLGTVHDRKFEHRVKEILDGLGGSEAKAFERAQVSLGRFLGYFADNTNEDSAPDPWWVLDENTGIVFEDYTDCAPGAVISVTKIRQAASHPRWLQQREEYRNIDFYPVIVTPAKTLGGGAHPHAKGLFYWEKADFVQWARTAIGVVRELRRTFPGQGDLMWRASAKDAYTRNGLDSVGILEKAKKTELISLPEPGDH